VFRLPEKATIVQKMHCITSFLRESVTGARKSRFCGWVTQRTGWL